MTLLEKLRGDLRVEIIDDERSIGNGIIITLRQGWSFDQMADSRVAGEDTLKDALNLLTRAKPYSGIMDP